MSCQQDCMMSKGPYPHADSDKIGARIGVELTDSTTDSVIIVRLSLLTMFNSSNPLKLTDGNRLTIAVGRREIGPVGKARFTQKDCKRLQAKDR